MRYFAAINEKWWCWGNQKDNVHFKSVGLLNPKDAAAQPVQIKAIFLQAFKMDSVLRMEVAKKKKEANLDLKNVWEIKNLFVKAMTL